MPKKQGFRRRTTMEAAIGNLKNDFRMAGNFLKGTAGGNINLLLSCAAFSFKKLLRELSFYFAKSDLGYMVL